MKNLASIALLWCGSGESPWALSRARDT